LVIVAVPAAKQVAAAVLTVGTAGVVNWAATLKEVEADEVQLLVFRAVTV
jgi:hypothetical protein